jgi:Two component regulator propeller
MKIGLAILSCLLSCVASYSQSLQPIGAWRNHLPLRQVIAVASHGDNLHAAAAYGVFSYKPQSKEFSTISRSDGLASAAISTMAIEPVSGQQLIAYENSNLDLIRDGRVINIPDILISRTNASKRINQILWQGSRALLATDLGIIDLDVTKRQVTATYKPGNAGTDIRVRQLAVWNNTLYAATDQGLMKCPFNVSQMGDYNNWIPEQATLSATAPGAIVNWNNRLVLQQGDSLFSLLGGRWQLFHAPGQRITFMQVQGSSMFVGVTDFRSTSVLHFLSPDTNPQRIYSPLLEDPTGCVLLAGVFWVGDRDRGIVRIDVVSSEIILPHSPYGIPKGEGVFSQGLILAPAGYVSADGIPEKNRNGLDVFDGDTWQNYNRLQIKAMDSLQDIVTAVLDPVSKNLLLGSYGGGLAEIAPDKKITIFKYGSAISQSMADSTSYRVAGLAYDLNNHLWVSNSGAIAPLLARKRGGGWNSFSIPFATAGLALGKIVVDIDNRKWIVAREGGGLICFDDAGTMDRTNDDRWRLFRQGKSNGNLPSSNVLTVAADKNGFVWVGTDRGVAVIQCGEDMFNSAACEAILPVVKQDNFAGQLLAEEYVNDIQVDAADRKWVATQNGVWLLGADGQKTIHRFTAANSGLLDDVVYSIAIQQETGEVFFFTRSGIASFRGTATSPATAKTKPFIFPNPVPPGYTGTIAFRNLPERAWVKITEINGKLVHETRSLGGQAVWDGKNRQGDRVSSGVYLIYVADESNVQQSVGKLFFIK